MSKIIQFQNAGIYQLKILLKESKPLIWRRCLVPGNFTLEKLHKVIQIVMGWGNAHLHEFRVGDVSYSEPDADLGEHVKDQKKVTLSEIAPKDRTQFTYLYDFGDSWSHEIIIEKIIPWQKKIQYPHCIDGERACPPEDCGGIWGYKDLLRALKNPKTQEQKELVEWVGDFNPLLFDVNDINTELKKIK